MVAYRTCSEIALGALRKEKLLAKPGKPDRRRMKCL
jgi:hypothetical protein